jgi:hypothetical protein
LPLELSPTRTEAADGYIALSGPSISSDPSRLALRGDLAHIKLAGRCFVPHYAAPMFHRTKAGATLLSHPREDADVIAALPADTVFEVLDIAKAWAWGQVEHDGLVGYIAMAELEPLI